MQLDTALCDVLMSFPPSCLTAPAVFDAVAARLAHGAALGLFSARVHRQGWTEYVLGPKPGAVPDVIGLPSEPQPTLPPALRRKKRFSGAASSAGQISPRPGSVMAAWSGVVGTVEESSEEEGEVVL